MVLSGVRGVKGFRVDAGAWISLEFGKGFADITDIFA